MISPSPNAGIERAGSIATSIRVLRMKGPLNPLRSNDLLAGAFNSADQLYQRLRRALAKATLSDKAAYHQGTKQTPTQTAYIHSAERSPPLFRLRHFLPCD